MGTDFAHRLATEMCKHEARKVEERKLASCVFTKTSALQDAVDEYFDNSITAEVKYRPIDMWDVSTIKDFSHLFSGYRNNEAKFLMAMCQRGMFRVQRQCIGCLTLPVPSIRS